MILADIGDVEVAGFAVEMHFPWIANAVGPDLGASGGLDFCESFFAHTEQDHESLGGDERVVRRDAIGTIRSGGVDVDAEDFGEQGGDVLSCIENVAFPAAITRANVEVAVWAKGEFAAVVVRVGLLDLHDHADRFFVGFVRVGLADLVFDDEGVAVEPHVRVVDVELAVGFEVGVEFQIIEALL